MKVRVLRVLRAQARVLVPQRQRRCQQRRQRHRQQPAALAAAPAAPPAYAEVVGSRVRPPEQGLPDGAHGAIGCRRSLQTAWRCWYNPPVANRKLQV